MRFILFFDTRHDGPSRFQRAELPKYSRGDKKCYVAVIEAATLALAWHEVFIAFHDYEERGSTDNWNQIPSVMDKNNKPIPPTFEDVANYYRGR